MNQSSNRVTVDKESLEAITNKVVKIVLKKNTDYGDAWQRTGIVGVLVRLSDKAMRVENLANGQEALVASEGIQDTLVDMIGYSLLGLLYLDKTNSKE